MGKPGHSKAVIRQCLKRKDTVPPQPPNQVTRKMMNSVSLLAVLVGSAFAVDGYSYSQQGYADPRDGAGGHAAHSAPASGYGAPEYAAPSTGYGGSSYSVESVGADVGAMFTDFLPILLVVFAAIILASLLAPLITQLLILVTGLLPLTLNIKAPIVNALLAPFNLVLAQFPAATTAVAAATAGTLTVFTGTGREFDAREFSDAFGGFEFSDEKLDIITNFVQKAIASFSESAEVYSRN